MPAHGIVHSTVEVTSLTFFFLAGSNIFRVQIWRKKFDIDDASVWGKMGGDQLFCIKGIDRHPGEQVSPAQAVKSPYGGMNTLQLLTA